MNMDLTKIGETDLIKEYLLQSRKQSDFIRIMGHSEISEQYFFFCSLNGRKLIIFSCLTILLQYSWEKIIKKNLHPLQSF